MSWRGVQGFGAWCSRHAGRATAWRFAGARHWFWSRLARRWDCSVVACMHFKQESSWRRTGAGEVAGIRPRTVGQKRRYAGRGTKYRQLCKWGDCSVLLMKCTCMEQKLEQVVLLVPFGRACCMAREDGMRAWCGAWCEAEPTRACAGWRSLVGFTKMTSVGCSCLAVAWGRDLGLTWVIWALEIGLKWVYKWVQMDVGPINKDKNTRNTMNNNKTKGNDKSKY